MRAALLPSLNKNVVSGNSLIGWDILEGKLFDSGEERKLNPMNFDGAFPEVMKRGGFDAIVGNPPYVLGRETFDSNAKQYLAENYAAFGGKYDLYIYFTERAISLVREDGFLGYILPNTILANENAINLRKLMLERLQLQAIRMFHSRVFAKAQVENVIIVATKNDDNDKGNVRIDSEIARLIPQATFAQSKDLRFNVSLDPVAEAVIGKIESHSASLGKLVDICIGIQLGGSSGPRTKESFLSTRRIDDSYKKVLDGKEINRYQLRWRGSYVHYGDWLHRKRAERYFLSPKILIRQIGKTPVASYDENSFYTLNTIYNLINSSSYSLKFILAIINSKVGQWFWLKRNFDYKSLFPKIKKPQIEAIPIPRLDLVDLSQRARHDRMVQLVDQILEAKKQLASARAEREKTFYENKCATTDRQIDNLIYELYDLTPEEIAIVEGMGQ